MGLRCQKCDCENDSRYRFCGMCGSELTKPQQKPRTEEQTTQSKPAREQVYAVSGPSFLGLADEPSNTAAYLLEDDVSRSHWGRGVFVVVVLGCVTAAAFHWHHDLREWAARFSHQSSATQTEQVSYSASPISSSSSEAKGPTAQSIREIPTSESTTQLEEGEQPQSAGSAAGQRNTLAAAEPIRPPSTAQPEAQTPVGGTPSTTIPVSEKEETSAPPGSFAEGRPAKESTAPPDRPEAPDVAFRSLGDPLDAEGERYLYGTESPANCARAQRDFLAAARRSSAKGESALGTMYATGHCVPRDLPLAYRWFAKALHQEPGNARFERDVQILWNQMTPDERRTAMRTQ